jgi:hypothetical protein
MASMTGLRDAVRHWRSAAVAELLHESPELRAHRDPRGRGWLHIACMVMPEPPARTVAAGVATVDVLLDLGFDLNAAAFTEGEWRATPLWHAVSRGRNLRLAAHLLARGADPGYCLYAAAWASDLEAIDLLVAAGAPVDERSAENGATPFLWAVSTSHFDAARALLAHGADPDAQDRYGQTALHLMLAKNSPTEHIAMVIRAGARLDVPDAQGRTAAARLARKRDPVLRALVARG